MSPTKDSSPVEALQSVLDAMLEPINQLFFHSHMLRAWGHSKATARNVEWIEKMRRARDLVQVLGEYDAHPRSRKSQNLALGRDAQTVLESDVEQTRTLIRLVDNALHHCEAGSAKDILLKILAAENKDLVELESCLAGPQAQERPHNAKHLMPKPDSIELSITSLDTVLPPMTAAVSQFFYYSLIFQAQGSSDLAQRELNAALALMFRTQAVLERLLDLGGVPNGRGHGRINLSKDEGGADQTSLDLHQVIIDLLEKSLDNVKGLSDPMTHTLLDGVLRAEREDKSIVEQRLAELS